MSSSKGLCWFALLLSVSVACAGNDSTASAPNGVVTDTLGVRFDVDCSSGMCRLTPQDSQVTPLSCDWGGYGTDAFTFLLSRLLIVHVIAVPPVGPLQASAAEPGHPVACTVDADCLPSGLGTSSGVLALSCRNGLCQDTSKPLSTNDIIALCQADIPWPKSCPYLTTLPFAARLAEIAATCGASTYCDEVPADCRQVDAAPVAPAIDAGEPSGPSAAGVDAGS